MVFHHQRSSLEWVSKQKRDSDWFTGIRKNVRNQSEWRKLKAFLILFSLALLYGLIADIFEL